MDSNLSDCTTQCRSNHSNAIVADYLGLNAEQDPEFPRSLAAHNPSEKKRAVAGKSQNSKGTKTANSIRERRAKTKPTAKASAPEDDSAARSSVYSDDPQHAVDAAGTIPVLDAMAPTESTVSQGTKRKRDAFKYNTTEGHPDRSSVAVVAPQTSLHTVRASQSFGISVYNNERRKSPRESIVQYSQPFLIRSIRDNEENLDSSGQMYEINQDSGTGNPSTEPKEGKARLGVGANTDLPNVDNAVLLLDEELLQDDPITDIDENDLLEMCIALEVNPSGNDERPSHVNGQLPTPLNSDWIAEPNPMDDNAGRLLSSGPDTILNEDEEWCTLDDEDDAEMLSLIETAEERARLSASPSEDTERSNRTRREKSKNMRTVEPTEMTYPFLDHRRKRNSRVMGAGGGLTFHLHVSCFVSLILSSGRKDIKRSCTEVHRPQVFPRTDQRPLTRHRRLSKQPPAHLLPHRRSSEHRLPSRACRSQHDYRALRTCRIFMSRARGREAAFRLRRPIPRSAAPSDGRLRDLEGRGSVGLRQRSVPNGPGRR